MTTFTSLAHTWSINAGATYTTGFYQALKALRDALIAGGMVQTADTGQQDFTIASDNVTTPVQIPTAGTSGFFIVRFNDTLQATKPFFMKIRMIAASGNNTLNGYQIQLGSGSDGAGNLTGSTAQLTNAVNFPASEGSSGAWGSTTQRATIGSGNGSEIVVSVHDAGNTQGESALFSIERTRDATGAYDGEGVLVQLLYASPNSATAGPYAHHAVYPTNGSTYALGNGWTRGLIIPRTIPDRASFQVGNDTGPMLPFGGGFFPKFRQTHVLYAFPLNDMVSLGNVFTIPVYGVNRSFRNLGSAYPINTLWQFSGSNGGVGIELGRYTLAMMWE